MGKIIDYQFLFRTALPFRGQTTLLEFIVTFLLLYSVELRGLTSPHLHMTTVYHTLDGNVWAVGTLTGIPRRPLHLVVYSGGRGFRERRVSVRPNNSRYLFNQYLP